MKPAMQDLLDELDQDEEPILTMDGYDDCLVGFVVRFHQSPIACYDRDKVLDKLVKSGMTYEEAVEWFEFNQIGAWVGEKTPCFLIKPLKKGK